MKKALIALLFGLLTIPALADNTIVENLQELIETRDAITNAIVQKGGTVTSGALTNVPNEILSIPAGGGDNGKFVSLVERTISGDITAEDLEGATTIGRDGFSRCPITSIEIPNTVTSIAQSAFLEITTLATIDIPDSVISIGDGVFRNSSHLSRIDFGDTRTTIPTLGGMYAFVGLPGNYQIWVPGELLASWKMTENWTLPNIKSHICPYQAINGGECVSEGNGVSRVGGGSSTFDVEAAFNLDWEGQTMFSDNSTLWIGNSINSIDDSGFEDDFGAPMYGAGGEGCWAYLKFCNIPQEEVETWSGYPWGFPTNNISYLSLPE